MMTWGDEPHLQQPLHTIPPATRRVLLVVYGLFFALVLALSVAGEAEGQAVSWQVEVVDGHGEARVLNRRSVPVEVEVALWESDETGAEVELTQPAEGRVWPTEFSLEPGERQFVRVLVPEDAYPEGQLLRLETVMTPTRPEQGEGKPADGIKTSIRLAVRTLSKVLIRHE